MSHAKPQPAHIRASGVPEGYDAQMILRELERAGSDETMVLHIARDDKRAESIAAALQFFAPDLTLLRFPGWDCLPYDRISPMPRFQRGAWRPWRGWSRAGLGLRLF